VEPQRLCLSKTGSIENDNEGYSFKEEAEID